MADKIIFDPVLAYIAAARNSGCHQNISIIVMDKFSPDQLITAKEALWKHDQDGSLLGDMPKRMNSKKRVSIVANLEDIMEAFAKLDECSTLPSFAVMSEDLLRIPRVFAEDINIVSMADRIGRLEDSLRTLHGKAKQDSAPSSRRQSHRNANGGTEQKKPHGQHLPWSGRNDSRDRSSSSTRAATSTSGVLDHARSSSQDARRTMSQIVAELAMTDDEPFTDVRPNKSWRRRGKQGADSDDDAFLGDSDTFVVQVTNVNPAVTKETITAFLGKKRPNAVPDAKVEDASTEGWSTKRFRITFPRDEKEEVMTPSFWPKRVYFREFKVRPQGDLLGKRWDTRGNF